MVGQDRFQFKKELISCQIVAVGNNAAASYVKTSPTQKADFVESSGTGRQSMNEACHAFHVFIFKGCEKTLCSNQLGGCALRTTIRPAELMHGPMYTFMVSLMSIHLSTKNVGLV